MPTEAQLHIQQQADIETIEQLIEAGSRPERTHRIEHHFSSSHFEALEMLASKADALGYDIGEPEQGEDENGVELYCFDVIGETPLEAGQIHQQSALMLRLAEEHGVDYDGWGTYLEN